MIPQKVIHELTDIVGEGYVLYAPEDLIVFEYDGSQAVGYPEVVVVPGSAEEVARVVKIAHREGPAHRAPGSGNEYQRRRPGLDRGHPFGHDQAEERTGG